MAASKTEENCSVQASTSRSDLNLSMRPSERRDVPFQSPNVQLIVLLLLHYACEI